MDNIVKRALSSGQSISNQHYVIIVMLNRRFAVSFDSFDSLGIGKSLANDICWCY